MTEFEIRPTSTIEESSSIRTAIKRMDEGGIGFIVVLDGKEHVIGVVTDGDFRRAVLSGVSLENKILDIANRNFVRLEFGFTDDELIHCLADRRINLIPVVHGGKLVSIISRKDHGTLKAGDNARISPEIPLVIMAGGKGTRMDPFTRVLPKSLIPIGDTPILEIIIQEYRKFGVQEFYVSLNHKDRMVRAYFDEQRPEYRIKYIVEVEPLGTAGALSYLRGEMQGTFFVTNCDIIIKTDYSKFYEFHKAGGFDLSLVGSVQNHSIPYGVCEIGSGGRLVAIKEKPEYSFIASTGMYLIEPSLLGLIEPGTRSDMTDLISRAMGRDLRVGVFPVSEGSWIDVGQWEEYKRAVRILDVF